MITLGAAVPTLPKAPQVDAGSPFSKLRVVRAVGIEPTLLSEPDFERSQMAYPMYVRHPARAR
jgi:hypothetical protein